MENRVYAIEDVTAATRGLMAMEKRPVAAMDSLKWPTAGDSLSIELESQEDRRIKFWLDLSESMRGTSLVIGAEPDRKTKQQARAGSQVLVRVEIADRNEILRHMNPDGTIVVGSHIHLDIEGYGIRWAMPLESQSVVVPEKGEFTPENVFEGLVRSCHVVGLPRVEYSLGV